MTRPSSWAWASASDSRRSQTPAGPVNSGRGGYGARNSRSTPRTSHEVRPSPAPGPTVPAMTVPSTPSLHCTVGPGSRSPVRRGAPQDCSGERRRRLSRSAGNKRTGAAKASFRPRECIVRVGAGPLACAPGQQAGRRRLTPVWCPIGPEPVAARPVPHTGDGQLRPGAPARTRTRWRSSGGVSRERYLAVSCERL